MFTKRRHRPSKHPPYRRQRFLCTAGEWRFCQKLEEAVGDRYIVMMQIRVGALLRCSAAEWKLWGRKVAQKSFDFVLVERGSSFAAAAIELDDKTHLLPERRARDKFLDQACSRARLPLLRFKTARRYDVNEIRDRVRAALPPGACEVRPEPKRKKRKPLGWSWRRRTRMSMGKRERERQAGQPPSEPPTHRAVGKGHFSRSVRNLADSR